MGLPTPRLPEPLRGCLLPHSVWGLASSLLPLVGNVSGIKKTKQQPTGLYPPALSSFSQPVFPPSLAHQAHKL